MTKLGLDLGSSSAGWALYENGEIEDYGVVIFNTGMLKGQSGGYVSPTKERRIARSKRNLIRARKYRKWALLKILISAKMVPLSESELKDWSKYKKNNIRKFPENNDFQKWLACDFRYNDGKKYKNPYQLRVDAAERKLGKHEFGRALYHIIQRRGYKDIGENDKETENQIQRRNQDGFKDALKKHGTISRALNEEFLKRNIRARNQYPLREEYQHELEVICKSQGFNIEKKGKADYQDEFVKSVWQAIIWQRPLKDQKGNIGKCLLEPSKPRCPVSHPVFEIFRTFQFINTIKYFDESGRKQPLPQDFRNQLFDFFLKKEGNFRFEEIRIFLDKRFGKRTKYNYPIDRNTGKYNSSVSGMPVCKGLISIFGEKAKLQIREIEKYNIGNAPNMYDKYSIYDLWHILFDFDEEHLEKFACEKLKIPNEIRRRKKKEISISPLVELKEKFQQGYAELSLKALTKIIPFLKAGHLYNEAVIMAKMPELLGEEWQTKKDDILELFKKSVDCYKRRRTIINITNNLIDRHKGLTDNEKFAYKDFLYTLQGSDIEDIKSVCEGYYGEKSWKEKKTKEEIINEVGIEYQEYFYDFKRAYRSHPTLMDILKSNLEEKNIHINNKLYHHSHQENRYSRNLEINQDTGAKDLPTDKKTGLKILPVPLIDSIKNPMFNKSMSVLRKLVNQLIVEGKIDEDTEVVIELARELNDNNKRAAIERYQNLRRDNREKYRLFLEEFKKNKKISLNVEESIPVFEMWTEQTFEETNSPNGQKVLNKNHNDILKEKNAIKRYELWMEQRGQCMYTGKMISVSQLFTSEIDIMHTIPRSILPDNTMANMTVGYARYNRDLQEQKLPKECGNYFTDKEGWGTSIEPRLEIWKRERDKWKNLFESRKKPTGKEDENRKNKRIQEKHYFKIHYNYWKDKVERFEAEEVKDSWARRQLVDTQMISKYAREFLKLYFKKVHVQKGSVTADFRKLFGFQEEGQIKSRKKHTHHAIDSAILTLIPVNSSRRERLLKKYYKILESKDKKALFKLRENIKPNPNFKPYKLICEIEGSTLIYNYEKDKILNQTFKKIRKRGKIQYVKDKEGNFVLDKDGNRIIKYAKGDTIRSGLYAQTYLGKIRDVERDMNGKPIWEKGGWKYRIGGDRFVFVKREKIEKVKSSQKLIESIIDSKIKELIEKQKNQSLIKDPQGNIIRHVRVKVKTGRVVKERINYRSKYDYKNKFYSEAGQIPYAVLLQKSKEGKVEREMIPIGSFEVANVYKRFGVFNFSDYIDEKYPQYKKWSKELLKVGQKVLVLKSDNEYHKRKNQDFQQKRLYVITQFSQGSIWLKYHLNAQSKDEIKRSIVEKKDELMREYEMIYNLPEITIDPTIEDRKEQINDYKNRKYRFDNISKSFRLSRLMGAIGEEKTKEIKNELDKYKAIPSKIEIEGEAALLKMSKENWNFLLEGKDFEMTMLGEIKW